MAKEVEKPVSKPDSESARLERERLTSLINSMADGVLALDNNKKIIIYNGASLNILDLNISLLNKKITDVLKLVDQTNNMVDFDEIIAKCNTQSVFREFKLVYGDKSRINLYISIAPVKLGFGAGGKQGYVLILRDITREKSLEEERDEFISVVSHELRTPIAIAEGNLGNVEFMFRGAKIDQSAKDAISQSHEQIVFLSGLINDLSTLSRAEEGALKLEPEVINAHELVNDLAKTYKFQASKKNLKLITEIDPNLELFKSSSLYLREILQNFITNAIKYTQEGTVTLRAKSAEGGIIFEVADTGIGIGPADQEKVFDKFFRSEDYRTRENNGTGLGLYITVKLAKLIGADLNLESQLNKGSTFFINVPNIA